MGFSSHDALLCKLVAFCGRFDLSLILYSLHRSDFPHQVSQMSNLVAVDVEPYRELQVVQHKYIACRGLSRRPRSLQAWYPLHTTHLGLRSRSSQGVSASDRLEEAIVKIWRM